MFRPRYANAVELKHLMAGKLFKALPANVRRSTDRG
jgi:hypothetical protein